MTTGPLRIMTFNVQMLPWIADTTDGTTNDAPERAERVADALFALPRWDRPDVIAFNEVFDEDGRDTLLARLGGDWPHVVQKLATGLVDEDSGLMLFSRLPYLPLPGGDHWFELFYADFADTDAWASKGVGVVRVQSPDGSPTPVTLAFTYLQAAYDYEDQYTDVRRAQLEDVWRALRALVEPGGTPDPHALERVVVMGDLNVRGDSGAVGDEWAEVFDQAGTTLTEHTGDGWRTAMHPPDDPADHDPGLTNLEWDGGRSQRLDYLLFGAEYEAPLVPHHMGTRVRNASDHFSLEAVVQRRSPHCQPATAFELSALGPAAGGAPGTPTTLTVVDTHLAHPGSFQWIWVKQPGTYTFWSTPDVELRVFAVDDLTNPLEQRADLDVAELAGTDVGDVLADLVRERPVDPRGRTHSPTGPFFVAVRSRKNLVGPRPVFVLEHHGESPATAVVLTPHERVYASFPEGQPLGDDDRCWFRAALPRTFAGDAHAEEFGLDNPDGGRVRFAVRDTALQELDAASGDVDLDLDLATLGDETVYLTVERSSTADTGFAVRWTSPVSYLMLERPLGLFVNAETGGFGSDEIRLQLTLDGAPLFNGYWDDADTDERWPGLAEAIIARIRSQLPGTDRAGFVSDLTISYIEEDVTAAGWNTALLRPLSSHEPDVVSRREPLVEPDDISDGLYTFYCSVTRRR